MNGHTKALVGRAADDPDARTGAIGAVGCTGITDRWTRVPSVPGLTRDIHRVPDERRSDHSVRVGTIDCSIHAVHCVDIKAQVSALNKFAS